MPISDRRIVMMLRYFLLILSNLTFQHFLQYEDKNLSPTAADTPLSSPFISPESSAAARQRKNRLRQLIVVMGG